MLFLWDMFTKGSAEDCNILLSPVFIESKKGFNVKMCHMIQWNRIYSLKAAGTLWAFSPLVASAVDSHHPPPNLLESSKSLHIPCLSIFKPPYPTNSWVSQDRWVNYAPPTSPCQISNPKREAFQTCLPKARKSHQAATYHRCPLT